MKDKFELELVGSEITLVLVALEKIRDENSFSERGNKLIKNILDKIEIVMDEEGVQD